jgi:hypothetical protein
MVKKNKSLPTQSTGILFHGGEVSACERLGGPPRRRSNTSIDTIVLYIVLIEAIRLNNITRECHIFALSFRCRLSLA